MLSGTVDISAAAGPARGRGPVFAAIIFAGLVLLPGGAGAMDCGAPLATDDCLRGDADGSCGLLYLQISNLVEDGPVLNGLSVQPQPAASPAGAGTAAQCRRAVAGPLPPADPGSPDRDCVAYLLPACTYGVQALFGDGSRALASGVRIAPPGAKDGNELDCARVTIDLGRQQVTSAPESCGEAVLAQLEREEGPLPAAGREPGGQVVADSVTAVTSGGPVRAEP